ncbi:glutamate receptor 2-like [Mytilus trossulus]|uniref:glutamate receptor 2-like n=2 Tax=Mytilus trossulus TaxID=6551 RepID=UPI003004E346
MKSILKKNNNSVFVVRRTGFFFNMGGAMLIWFLVFSVLSRTSDGIDIYGDIGLIQDSSLHYIDRQGMDDAFKYAIQTFNNDQSLRQDINSVILKSKGHNVTDIDNSYQLTRQICHLLPKNIILFIADSSQKSMEVYESMSSNLEIPIVLPRGPGYNHTSDYVFDMTPSFIGAIIDYIQYFGWKVVYYVYDSEESLHRIQEIYRAQKSLGTRSFSLRPKRIVNISDSYAVLRSVDKHRYCDSDMQFACNMRIILDLSTKEAFNLTLEQIINVGMNRDEYHYILGGLGIQELDLSAFAYGGVNITGFSMLNAHSATFKEIDSDMNRKVYQNLNPLTIDKAMMIDAVRFIGKGIDKYLADSLSHSFKGATCNKGYKKDLKDTPTRGSLIAKSMKQVELPAGLTGKVAFDSNGLRKDYTLEVHQMGYKSKLTKIGDWSPNRPSGKRFETNIPSRMPMDRSLTHANRTWRIATKISKPFVQDVTSPHTDKRTDGVIEIDGKLYEGYCIELIQQVKERYLIEHKTDFNFKFHFVKDNEFGKCQKDFTWNGMVGELIRNETDLALSSLTITEDRQRVVDFTTPFMQMGISIMIKKPDKQKPGVFSFMDPLDVKVWICVMVGFLAVSLVLFFVGRWSPYEWREILNSRDQSNAFTFSNTLWFALGALMQQGSDIFPRSISGRVVGSAWWFFTLILISSYTANLAAFLTIERLLTPIRGADDLVGQTKIKYGAYKGGATEKFFEQSKVTTFSNMWKYMLANYDSVMVDKDEVGVQKVRDSKHDYAYLLESPRNQYENQKKPCNTMKVGENLVNKGYGISTQFELSELRKNLTLVILKLNQEGVMYRLEQRWWYDKGECGSDTKDNTKSALTLSNVSGIFHILIGGLVISMCVALFEFIIHSIRKKHKQRYKSTVKSTVKIEKKNPLEVLKAAGYSEIDNSGYAQGPPDYDHLKTFGDGATYRSEGDEAFFS